MWSEKLANMAKDFATKCEIRSNPDRHSIPSMKTVGEIWSTASTPKPGPEQSLEHWYYEGAEYEYETKNCTYKSGCNNFTQVGIARFEVRFVLLFLLLLFFNSLLLSNLSGPYKRQCNNYLY